MQDAPRTPLNTAPERGRRLARYLSIIGHPYGVIPASIAAVSVLRGGDTGAAAGVALVFLLVSVAVLAGMRAGRFNDFDVSERERRGSYYALVAAGTAALSVWLSDRPEAQQACVVAGALLAACGLVNGWVKASLHTAFALYAAGFWAGWSFGAGLAALPVAALIAWSRVRLGRHSVAEVSVGAALGLVAAVALVWLRRTSG